MGIERILSSPGRIRVLKIILKYGQINVTRLAREASLHHRLVSKYIDEMREEGIVSVYKVGRIRIVELNVDNPQVALLRELLLDG